MKYERLIKPLLRLIIVLLLLSGGAAAQDDVFPVPDSFKTEGIPTLKKSDVERVLVDPASVGSNLIWDTDVTNRRLLVTDSVNGVYLVDSPMASLKPTIGKVIPMSVRVRPKQGGFAYLSDHEDEDNYQIYLFDPETKASRTLTRKSGDDTVSSIVWSADGTRIFYARVDYEKKVSRVCANDLSNETCRSEELTGTWEVLASDADLLLLRFWNSTSNQQLFTLKATTGKPEPLETSGNNRRAGLVDGQVYWLNEGGPLCPDHPCVLYRDLRKGVTSAVNIPAGVDSTQDLKLSPNGRYLMLLEIKDGIDRIHVLEVRRGKFVREMPGFIDSGLVVWHTRWLGGSEIAYTTEHVGRPPSIHSFDFKSKRFTDWTRERMPESLAGKLAAPEPIKWKSFDGRQIPGYIVKPTNAQGRIPVLIFVHGGPLMLDRPVFSATESALVSALGIAVIHTNVRGSSGLGREFMEADDREKRCGAIEDIRSLIDWVQTRPDLDEKRIALRGESYGGWVVLGTAMAEPARIKAVVAEFPLVSIRGMVSMSWADETVFAEYGNPKDEQLMKKLEDLSPLNNAGRWNQIPLLLTRGKRDERSPEQNTTDLKDQLRAKGSEVWWIYSMDAGHGVGGRFVDAAIYRFLKDKL